jgi:hypothetical protein
MVADLIESCVFAFIVILLFALAKSGAEAAFLRLPIACERKG